MASGDDGRDRPGAVWIDGTVLAPGAPGISPFDHGFTVGDGLFETVLVTDGEPQHWFRHLARLRQGLERLGIALPRSDAELTEAVGEVLTAAHLRSARLRVTVTSGPGPSGVGRGGPATVVVSADALVPAGGPVAVVSVPWVRNERSPLAGLKSTSYGEAVEVLAHARRVGADEAVLADTEGRLSEAVTANLFVVVDGVALTPSLATGCLPGIVRALLLERRVAVEADLAAELLATIDEAFLTSSLRGVQPIGSIDGRALRSVHGALTRAAAAALDLP